MQSKAVIRFKNLVREVYGWQRICCNFSHFILVTGGEFCVAQYAHDTKFRFCSFAYLPSSLLVPGHAASLSKSFFILVCCTLLVFCWLCFWLGLRTCTIYVFLTPRTGDFFIIIRAYGITAICVLRFGTFGCWHSSSLELPQSLEGSVLPDSVFTKVWFRTGSPSGNYVVATYGYCIPRHAYVICKNRK